VTSLNPFASGEGIHVCAVGIAIAEPHVIATTIPDAAKILNNFIVSSKLIVKFTPALGKI